MTESDAMAIVSLVCVMLFLRWQFAGQRLTKFLMDLIVVWSGSIGTVLFVTSGPMEFRTLNKTVALAGAVTLLVFGSYKALLDARKQSKQPSEI